MKDLGGIEPPKSFRNAEVSVPYGALEESVKLEFDAFLMQKIIVKPLDLWYNKILHKNYRRWNYGEI